MPTIVVAVPSVAPPMNTHAPAEFVPSPEQLRLLVGSLRDGVWLWDTETKSSYVSPRIGELLGCGVDRVPATVEALEALVHPEDWPAYLAAIREQLAAGVGYSLLVRMRKEPDGFRYFQVRSDAQRDPESGAVRFLAGSMSDVHEQELTRRLLVGERRVAEMIARRENLKDTLTELVGTLELQMPGAVCSVLMVDPENKCLRDGAAPGLPPEFRQAVDGLAYGPIGGSCGTAVHRKEVVVVEDIATDPLWADYRHLILPHGYRSCWSFPVEDPSGEVLATFAVYRRRTHYPDDAEKELVRRAAHLVDIAVRDHREQNLMRETVARLSRSEARLAFHMRETPLIILELDAGGAVRFWNPAAELAFGYTAAEALGASFWDLIIPATEVEKVSRIWNEILSRTGSIHAENANRTKDGRTIVCEWSNTRLLDSDGRVTGVATIGRDVTESRRMVEALRESERRYATVVSATKTGLWDWNIGKGEVYFSPEWCRLLGYEPAEVAQRVEFFHAALHPADLDRVQRLTREHLAGQSPVKIDETRLRTKSGAYRWFLDSGTVISRDVTGAPIRMVGTITDITDLKAAQEELLRNARILRSTEVAAKVGGWEFDVVANKLFWTEETYRLHDLVPGEFGPTVDNAIAFYTPESARRISECVRRCIAQAVPYDDEFEIITSKGRRLPVRSAGLPLVVGGSVVRVYGAFQDISEIKSRENALRQRDALMRAVAGMARDLLGAGSLRTVIGGILQRLGEAVGVSRALVFENVLMPDGSPGVVPRFKWLAPGIAPADPGAPPDKAYSYDDGFGRWREVFAAGGEIWGTAIEMPPDEAAHLRALGILAVLKVPVFVRGVWWGSVGFDDCETERRWSPGEVDALKTAAGILGEAIGRENDAVERHAFEIKLQETQKLESLGILAGGIAHDFNNLLTTILGNASLVHEALAHDAKLLPLVGQIEQASQHAAELCQQMLAYSGRSSFVTRRADLNVLVAETVGLLKASLNKKIAFELHLADALPGVRCDVAQIRQIILNLIINAGDSIGDAEGRILLRTRSLVGSPELFEGARVVPEVPGGPFVEFSVEDTGGGMCTETLARIFDPFFTTKFAGRGLGLAAVLGIVRGHRGALGVTSKVGRGSCFTVHFPAVDPAPKSPAPPAVPASSVQKGKALVIDDEEGIRNVTCSMLRRIGYDPETAVDGADGLAKFRDDPERYSLVLVDLTMPKMDGYETLAGLRKLSANVPVFLMSGYDESMAASRVADAAISGFIQKPFSLGGLRERLASI